MPSRRRKAAHVPRLELGQAALMSQPIWRNKMKTMLIAAALVAAVTAAHAQSYELGDSWAEDARTWECALPRQNGAADRDRDRVYKTELYITYANSNSSVVPIAHFNVRHTTASGAVYDRPNQYTGITTRNVTTRNGGVQTWSGWYIKNSARKIVGELKYSQGRGIEAGPDKAVYTEYHYDNGRQMTTVVHQCHYVGPGC